MGTVWKRVKCVAIYSHVQYMLSVECTIYSFDCVKKYAKQFAANRRITAYVITAYFNGDLYKLIKMYYENLVHSMHTCKLLILWPCGILPWSNLPGG